MMASRRHHRHRDPARERAVAVITVFVVGLIFLGCLLYVLDYCSPAHERPPHDKPYIPSADE